jgi:hypothetical protein
MAIAVGQARITAWRVRRHRAQCWLGRLLVHAGLLAALVFFLGPFFWIVTTSNPISRAPVLTARRSDRVVQIRECEVRPEAGGLIGGYGGAYGADGLAARPCPWLVGRGNAR